VIEWVFDMQLACDENFAGALGRLCAPR